MDEARQPVAPAYVAPAYIVASGLGLYAALFALAPSPVWKLALAVPPLTLLMVWWDYPDSGPLVRAVSFLGHTASSRKPPIR